MTTPAKASDVVNDSTERGAKVRDALTFGRRRGEAAQAAADAAQVAADAAQETADAAVAATYTNEMAQDAVGGMVDATLVYVDATPLLTRAALTGDVTAAQASNATTIANDAVSNAKLRNSGALSVIGRSANSSGDPADISATPASGAVLRESGSVLGFGTVATAGIANDAVTYAKMQDITAVSKLLGRGSAAGAGDPEEITLGTGLSMSGTTLNASGGGGGANLGLVYAFARGNVMV